MLPSKSTELLMSLSCRDGKVGWPGQAWLGRGTPTCSSSGSRFPGMNCFLASASSWSVVGLSAASHEHTSLTGVVLGEIMLLHRTGCHQANGLLGLVCIYLYGVNSEPQFWAAWGEQALRCTTVRLSPASQHYCSEVLLLSLGRNPWRSQSKEGSELSSHLYTPRGSLLTWTCMQSCSPLDAPSASSELESGGVCTAQGEHQGQGSSRNVLCNFFD